MRRWSPSIDGEHRSIQPHLDDLGYPRLVYRIAGLGVHHGYGVEGELIGALLAGPGVDETGAAVPELLDPAEVARRTLAANDSTAEQTRRDQEELVVRALWQRCKPPAAPGAPAALTNREVAALLIILRGLK